MAGDNEILDDEWEAFEHYEIDQVLRQRFDRAFPIRDTSFEVLNDLRPVVAKARHRYVARRVVSWSVAASLFIAAGFLAVDEFVPADGGAVLTGPADSNGQVSDVSGDATSALPLPTPVAGVSDSVGVDDTADDQSGGQSVAGASSREGEAPATTAVSAPEGGDTSSVPSSATQTTSQTTTVPTTPSTSNAPTTTTPATSAPAAPATTLNGPCGYLTYDVLGYRTIGLVDAVSTGSRTVSVLTDRSDHIKVSFSGAGDRCNLEVEFVDGKLKTTVGDSDDDDD